MTWQVKFARSNVTGVNGVTSAEPVGDEALRITMQDQPDVLAVISASHRMNAEVAVHYHDKYPDMDFLCGFRTSCRWEGDAIRYLEGNNIGWGTIGTLNSALPKGSVNSAAHKDFVFADRLLRQARYVATVFREFDQVYTVTLVSGRTLRIGMIMHYEPTADSVRSLWDEFGAVDIAWNINPNGSPTPEAIEAGRELGCEVVQWDDLKAIMKKR